MHVVGGQTLDQIRVMEEFHELDLPVSSCPVFGGPDTVELPSALQARLFVGQPEHFAKLPAGWEKKKTKTFCSSYEVRRAIQKAERHSPAQLLVQVVVVGHLVCGVDGYGGAWIRLLPLLLCTQRRRRCTGDVHRTPATVLRLLKIAYL